MPHPYIALAQRAIDYVRPKVRASNRAADRAVLQGVDQLITAMELEYFQSGAATSEEEIKTWARLGLEHGVGNCQVQASLAFDYLAKLPHHPKLELMSLNQNDFDAVTVTTPVTGAQEQVEAPDHVFVVIGRTAGQIPNYLSWNHDAVVCDPWAKRAYFASDFGDEMTLINRVSGGRTATTQMHELAANANW